MKLYFSTGACSLSPRIVLMEAGLPFTAEKADLKSKKTASGADYLAINSKGSVPALELDDGQVLTEGPAIVQYLADLKPETQLAPRAGSFARYRLMEILNFITSEVHKGYSPAVQAGHSARREKDRPRQSRQETRLAVDPARRQEVLDGRHVHRGRCLSCSRCSAGRVSCTSS